MSLSFALDELFQLKEFNSRRAIRSYAPVPRSDVGSVEANPTFGEKSLIQLAHNRLILRSVAEKNAEFTKWVSGRHEGFPRHGMMVKLYGRTVIAKVATCSRTWGNPAVGEKSFVQLTMGLSYDNGKGKRGVHEVGQWWALGFSHKRIFSYLSIIC
jgi:hypothetical protein